MGRVSYSALNPLGLAQLPPPSSVLGAGPALLCAVACVGQGLFTHSRDPRPALLPATCNKGQRGQGKMQPYFPQLESNTLSQLGSSHCCCRNQKNPSRV